ncbi:hypothetical protein OU787_09155 [Kitasatospora sp. YST-16]|uniref:hypothetical protein n=1 Tax=Kitasatospora sp. YST-16 TaxID=2998080 RepID=UPI00228448DD|nr:hypothetical protein [Kitasatospora sp. YST-16]WAL71661.1 hypothetical protein OU787_09155 [Kitasatospora sp. YST-16]WNW37702.1 hypothetical protein RKE32_09115 [Streptomyces sp. Li-HN-5-13]
MAEPSASALADRVNPEKLAVLLEESGWKLAGGRRGVYLRLAPPGENSLPSRSAGLLLPLDQEDPDYREIMEVALNQIAQNHDFWIRTIFPRLAINSSDEFRFCRESAAPSGLIDWRSGERLIESARRAMIAGAKYYMGPERHFVNRHGRFASRYLDQVLMGQTAPGSYIVTAFVSPAGYVPLKSEPEPALEGFGAVSSRAVSEAVVKAVEATLEAVDHFKSTGTLSGFLEGVQNGVSYEMTNALLGMASMSDGADITVDWDSAVPFDGSASIRYELQGSDAEVLTKAAQQLAEDDGPEYVTVIGRVHLLAKKQAGSPGVFGVESIGSGAPRKVRVRLADEEDYHAAIRAHEEDLGIQVSGTLEKEGNLSWLYNATVLRIIGPIEELDPKKRPKRTRTQNDEPRLFDLPE